MMNKNIYKTIIILLISICLFSCAQNPEQVHNEGILTVVNATEKDFVRVIWKFKDGEQISLGTDDIYEVPTNMNTKGIQSKSEYSITLKEGKGTLFFYLADGGDEMELNEEFEIKKSCETEILITNETLVKYYKK